MLVLHNKTSNQQLKTLMRKSTEPRTTVSFYKYCLINNPQTFRDHLYIAFSKLKVLGRIYIAPEGINAQISVPTRLYKTMTQLLYQARTDFYGLRMNIALDNTRQSFWVLRIKVRNRIVADGIKDRNFNPSNVGHYLQAKEVNSMLQDPDVVFVDMRNYYEYEVGHFNNAIEVPSHTFRDQLPMAVDILQKYKEKKIVMYCTGGIRCEKASAYMLYHGFKNVYHLEGGIIEYTRYAREHGLPLMFIGKNFVFDERMGEPVTNDVISKCHQCGISCDRHTNCLHNSCHLLFIQCSSCSEKYKGCCNSECREKLNTINRQQ
ncbi:UPF0176 protein Spro_1886 [Candidatus Profftia tarda]|uniref:tRNA uridine(34) hydroxylase n=1 Tax=Candidatus Profftia tarda TaxID=1177216 RepID=A0A8E4H4E6_9ENTR|nr:rhodanese-related sulfurtransferase [Candidatus Profftia tarda]CAD6507814.1 UPF0176 protein Spro_1886 [Candidatus Profftia tarda]